MWINRRLYLESPRNTGATYTVVHARQYTVLDNQSQQFP